MKKNYFYTISKGFTIIELIVVIILVAILALGINSFNFNQKTTKEKQDRFVEAIIWLINTAKTDAMIGRSVKNGAVLINPSSIQLSISTGSLITQYMNGSIQIGTGGTLEYPFFWETWYEISTITNSWTSLSSVIIQFTGTNITYSWAISPILEIKAWYNIWSSEITRTVEFDRRTGRTQIK